MNQDEVSAEIARIEQEIQHVTLQIECIATQVEQLKNWREVQEGADPQ